MHLLIPFASSDAPGCAEALRGLRRGARDDECALRPRLEAAGVKVTGPFRA